MPPRFISQQLSLPTGLFARLMGRLMNRGNAKMNAFAVRQLELNPLDRVIEVGFGGGVTLLFPGDSRQTPLDELSPYDQIETIVNLRVSWSPRRPEQSER